jgi:type II secretory pathway pseudopilin PulG
MRQSERVILTVLGVVGLLVAVWLLVLAPKRDEASKLSDQASSLRSSLTQVQQDVAAGQQAQRSFGTDYRRLVVLGKAVPTDDEQASLLVQLKQLAYRSGVQFQAIDLTEPTDATAAPPPPPPADSSSSSDSSSSTDSSSSSTTTSSTSSAPATEAAAATLPIGAAVGPAGLPVMAYDLTFTGEFFQIADFMRSVDGMVHMRGGTINVHGRLLTVNGFTLEPSSAPKSLSNPVLTADLNVTTYLTPADQGLTGGATPVGPSSTGPTLASSSSSTGTSTPTETSTSTTP